MIAFLVSAIRLGMTFLLGSTGETITEKAGHLNLGLPGIMCMGAACGCYAEYAYLTDMAEKGLEYIPWMAVLLPILAALLGGAVMGLLFSFFTVTLRANQNVTGLAVTTLGVGLSEYIIGEADVIFSKASKHFTNPLLPFADELGSFGKLVFGYGIFVYLALAIALITTYILNKTRIGLHLRAVGENPATADAAGINVPLYRYVATCIGCGIAGLGGLSFIMDYLNGMWEYCVDAIGWLSLALVIFTVWKPNWAILGSVVFGALYVASSYIPGVSFAGKELFKMLPYVVTILVLIVTSMRNRRENQPPQSLGLSYFREDR